MYRSLSIDLYVAFCLMQFRRQASNIVKHFFVVTFSRTQQALSHFNKVKFQDKKQDCNKITDTINI